MKSNILNCEQVCIECPLMEENKIFSDSTYIAITVLESHKMYTWRRRGIITRNFRILKANLIITVIRLSRSLFILCSLCCTIVMIDLYWHVNYVEGVVTKKVICEFCKKKPFGCTNIETHVSHCLICTV